MRPRKLERAWLTPLRSTDHSALGLRAALGGSTPAEQAARERLGGPDHVGG